MGRLFLQETEASSSNRTTAENDANKGKETRRDGRSLGRFNPSHAPHRGQVQGPVDSVTTWIRKRGRLSPARNLSNSKTSSTIELSFLALQPVEEVLRNENRGISAGIEEPERRRSGSIVEFWRRRVRPRGPIFVGLTFSTGCLSPHVLERESQEHDGTCDAGP